MQHRFPSGLTITVSSPDTFEPSPDAYPPAERAVAFGIKIFNDTEQPYRLSHLSVRATVADEEIKQLQDPSQGYNGIVDADQDVPVGETEEFTLAFAVPENPARLRLVLHPDIENTLRAAFAGRV